MFCSECGSKQPEGGRFCFNCGEALIGRGGAPSASPSESPAVSTATSEPPAVERPAAAPEPTSEQPSVAASSAFSSGVHPWRRYFAHTIDLGVLGIAVIFSLAFIGFTIAPDLTQAALDMPIVLLLTVYLGVIPVESALLSTTGTTLGKGIFGIRVEHQSGRLLTFSEAATRGLLRYFWGEGLGVPLITLFTMANAHKQLTNDGITGYDSSTKSRVRHKTWGALRAVAATVATVIVFMMLGALNSLD